jgi:hypothetical protein
LLPLEAETEIVLNQMESSKPKFLANAVHWRRKNQLRPKLLDLIARIKYRLNLIPYSDNQFLVDLAGSLSNDLEHYRERSDEIRVQNLKISLKQYLVALNVFHNRLRSSSESKSTMLEKVFGTGNDVLLSDFSSPFNIEPLENFLQFAYAALFLHLGKDLTRSDLEAINLQSLLISMKLVPIHSKDLKSPTLGLENLSNLLQPITHSMPYVTYNDEITLSMIVAGDLLKVRTFARYENTMRFLNEYPINEFTDRLIPYLKKSVKNRYYIVPDYNQKKDILAALDMASEHYFEGKSENSQNRLLGYYVLVKFWINTSADDRRCSVALQKMREESVSAKNVIWNYADNLKLDSYQDLFKFDGQTFSFYQLVESINEVQPRDIDIQALLSEFNKPEYDNLCPGSNKFRELLKKEVRNLET